MAQIDTNTRESFKRLRLREVCVGACTLQLNTQPEHNFSSSICFFFFSPRFNTFFFFFPFNNSKRCILWSKLSSFQLNLERNVDKLNKARFQPWDFIIQTTFSSIEVLVSGVFTSQMSCSRKFPHVRVWWTLTKIVSVALNSRGFYFFSFIFVPILSFTSC